VVDYFAIGLTHGLIALAAWRLFLRDDLDREPDDDAPDSGKAARPWLRDRDG
jgi:hypothetical protein